MKMFSNLKQKKTYRMSKLGLFALVLVACFMGYRTVKSYTRPGCTCGSPSNGVNNAQVYSSTSDEAKYDAPPAANRPLLPRIGIGMLTPKVSIAKALPTLGGKVTSLFKR